jgi:hypothetical protein
MFRNVTSLAAVIAFAAAPHFSGAQSTMDTYRPPDSPPAAQSGPSRGEHRETADEAISARERAAGVGPSAREERREALEVDQLSRELQNDPDAPPAPPPMLAPP